MGRTKVTCHLIVRIRFDCRNEFFGCGKIPVSPIQRKGFIRRGAGAGGRVGIVAAAHEVIVTSGVLTERNPIADDGESSTLRRA